MPKIKKTSKKQVTKEIKDQKKEDKNFDKLEIYSIEKAIEWTKELSKAKFDASMEVHFRLGIDPKKGDQQVRGAVILPHGTGKTIKVAAFVSPENEQKVKDAGADLIGNEELIAKIKKTEKTDFEVAVAEPKVMRLLAPIAKILGTRGLMPSPKNETVTPDPAKAVAELKKGKVSYKNDDTANIHVVIGKISFDNKNLLDNYNKLLNSVKKAKPTGSKGIYMQNISLSSSMGPGVKVEVNN